MIPKSILGSMKRFIFGVIVAGIIVFAFPERESFGWPATGDYRPYGALSYFGSPAPMGTQLQAKIQGIMVVEGTVTAAGWYALVIPPDNPSTTVIDGWRTDDHVTIWADGHEARPDLAAVDGPRRLDLVVFSITLDVKKSTWGKIKALFR